MNGLPFLKRSCPGSVLRYCDTPPVCRYLDRSTGWCTYPTWCSWCTIFEDLHRKSVEDTGVLSGRNWT